MYLCREHVQSLWPVKKERKKDLLAKSGGQVEAWGLARTRATAHDRDGGDAMTTYGVLCRQTRERICSSRKGALSKRGSASLPLVSNAAHQTPMLISSCCKYIKWLPTLGSRAFTAKLGGPVCAPLQVIVAHRRP